MGFLGEFGDERRLKRLVRSAGPGWEIVTAGTVRIGHIVLTEDKGPLKVIAIVTADSDPEGGIDSRGT